jgi:hypothetical protein
MKHTARIGRWAGLAAMSVLGSTLTNAANAQTQIYGYPTDSNREHEYALLNGDLLALYLNDRGDLGAPYPIISGIPGAKPPGIVDPATGRPSAANIGNDGRILPQDNPPTYGALFNRNPTPGSLGESVRAKSEYLTAGTGAVAEGFSLIGGQGLSGPGNSFLQPSDFLVTSFTTNGQTNRLGPLSATSGLQFPTNTGNLDILQNVIFQEDNAPPNRVKFTITFTNNSDETITGLRYARAVDPNQGFTTGVTTQRFRTEADPTAFAINSLVGDRGFGFGVLPDGNTEGLILLSTNEIREASLLSRPLAQVGAKPYVRLGAWHAGPNGTQTADAFMVIPAGDPNSTEDDIVIGSTTDYINDAAFTTLVNENLDTPSGNAGLVLLSPVLPDLAPDASTSFTFYYFFDAIQGPPGDVPEPGTVALLVSSGFCGIGLAWRRRRAKR